MSRLPGGRDRSFRTVLASEHRWAWLRSGKPQTEMTWARGRSQRARHPLEELPNPPRSASASQPSPVPGPRLKNYKKKTKKASPPPAPSQFQASEPEPGRGELTQPVLVGGEGPAAGSASHWLRSRLCADWLRRWAAALGESPLALRSRDPSVAARPRQTTSGKGAQLP